MELIGREDYVGRIRPFIGTDLIKVLTGMRRCGKSAMLELIKDDLREGGVSDQQFFSYNFELMAHRALLEPEQLYGELSSRLDALPQGVTAHIFLDEIQEVPEWERVLASLRLEYPCDIYITGSNATLLSGELATKLAGRYVECEIQPFSFVEFCEAYRRSAGQATDQELFGRYISLGGMPFLANIGYEPSACAQYLRDTFDAVQLKDIVARYKVRDADLLERILGFAYGNIGQPFSANAIVKFLKSEGRKVSTETVLNYLSHAASAYLIYPAANADPLGKQMLAASGKYFIADHGIREAVFGNNERDIAQVLENIVYLELRRRGWNVSVGRIGTAEVDFVAERQGNRHYYQVSYMLASPETVNREFGSLLAIPDNYPKTVLSLDPFDRSRDGIEHRNLITWLLNRD